MGFSFHSEQWLPHPVEAVFAFFADPENIAVLMPPWQKARIEKMTIVPPSKSAPTAGLAVVAAGVGTRVTVSFLPFRHAPFRIRWEAEITEFGWNTHFADRQVRGPFAYWDHAHRLRAIDREGLNVTLIVDHIDYDVPYGVLGKLAHNLFLRRKIAALFAFRQSEVARVFSEIKPKTPQSHPKMMNPAATA
jgi:ligand-binding SRPBCC domain-containing protein